MKQLYLDFIANEMRPLNSQDLNPPDYYVRENIRGQSQVPSKTEDNAELQEMLQMTSNSPQDKVNRAVEVY